MSLGHHDNPGAKEVPMSKIIKISIPQTEAKQEVDIEALPHNVRDRLIELGLTAHIRSSVNSAFSTELDKAMREDEKEVREAFEAAEKAALEANPKYKVKTFKSKYADKKAVAAFKEAFETVVDPVEVAAERVKALMEGTIRMARGEGGKNSALLSLVKANIVAVLKSKGKKHRDALAMVGDDPMQFIEKTARKRAGEDNEVYKTELAKLTAQYVEPARAMLADEPDDSDGEDGEGEGNDANDLI